MKYLIKQTHLYFNCYNSLLCEILSYTLKAVLSYISSCSQTQHTHSKK